MANKLGGWHYNELANFGPGSWRAAPHVDSDVRFEEVVHGVAMTLS